MADEHRDQIRIVQETVAGKEITFAHIMGGPAPIIYQKLGLNPQVDYGSSAIGIMNMTPSESAVIASDIAVKSGNVYLGFADRFTGTLIITGEISDVQTAMEEIVDYFRDTLGYVVCKISKCILEERTTNEEQLERLFHDDYENLKGKRLRLTRVRVPGKELSFAHVFTPSDKSVYENLALHIGVHEGEDHRGDAIGMVRVTPWEAIVVAADVAVKAAHVEVGFMDRFCGTLILTGGFTEVMTAVEEVVRFFHETLKFDVCKIHRS